MRESRHSTRLCGCLHVGYADLGELSSCRRIPYIDPLPRVCAVHSLHPTSTRTVASSLSGSPALLPPPLFLAVSISQVHRAAATSGRCSLVHFRQRRRCVGVCVCLCVSLSRTHGTYARARWGIRWTVCACMHAHSRAFRPTTLRVHAYRCLRACVCGGWWVGEGVASLLQFFCWFPRFFFQRYTATKRNNSGRESIPASASATRCR